MNLSPLDGANMYITMKTFKMRYFILARHILTLLYFTFIRMIVCVHFLESVTSFTFSFVEHG